jgi:protocatechuate 3,4-dioxygenase beta subunit
VRALSSAWSATGGGRRVTVIGSGFTGATKVRFGSAGARHFHVVSDSQLVAVVPAHAAGLVVVSVTTGAGRSPVELGARFTFGGFAKPRPASSRRALAHALGRPADSFGGSLTGTVSDTAGRALGGTVVTAYANFGYESDEEASTTTAANGSYSLSGLFYGQYDSLYVCFDGSSAMATPARATASTGYAGTCSDNVTTSTLSEALPVGGEVTGTVTDHAGTGLAGVQVQGEDDSANPETTTSSSGSYALKGLDPGSEDVCFYAEGASGGSSTTGYLDSCFGESSPGGDATPVTVSAGAVTAGVNEALTTAAAIGGTVTGPSGEAVQNVSVEVTPINDEAEPFTVGYASTNAHGYYAAEGLASGTYAVCFDASGAISTSTGYVSQCYQNKPYDAYGSETPVSATLGSASAVNVSLAAGGEISGKVTDNLGHPLAGVYIDISDGNSYMGQPVTAADGSFSARGVAPGTVSVCYDVSLASGGSSTTGYLDPTCSTVTVTASHITTVSAKAPTAGAIAGTITDAAGKPLADVDVVILDSNENYIGSASSNAQGSYIADGLAAGSLTVCFDIDPSFEPTGGSSSYGYLSQCYKNVAWDGSFNDIPPNPKAVKVKAGKTTSKISAKLAAAGAVGGTVTDASGSPLGDVYVEISTSDGGCVIVDGDECLAAASASDGTWTIEGLAPGNYTVCFDASYDSGSSATGYVGECYKNADLNDYSDATPVSVRSEVSTPVNIALPAGGVITGSISDTGGHPLPDAQVIVYGQYEEFFAIVASDGTYQVDSLPTGSYTICFSDEGDTSATGYAGQCYKNVSWDGGQTPSSTTPVSVTEGDTTPGVNAALGAGAEIAGTLTDRAGDPLSGVNVDVYDLGGNYVGYGGYDTQAGSYSVTSLAPGTYTVCFDAAYNVTGGTSADESYAGQCYKNVAWDDEGQPAANAKPVAVTGGAEVGGVSASLTAD